LTGFGGVDQSAGISGGICGDYELSRGRDGGAATGAPRTPFN
jgi:hypothetical protein